MNWLGENGKWVAAYVILGGALFGMVEAGAGGIAAPLSVLILTGVIIANGQTIAANVNELVGA